MPGQHDVSDALYHPIPQALASTDTSFEEEINTDDTVAESYDVVDSRIRWAHFLLGCAVLLPWNALITATPFFQSRVAGTSLKSVVSSYLSITFTVANFVFLAHATATIKNSSSTRRVLYSLTALATLCFFLTFSTFTHPTPGGFFAFVLLNAFCQAAAGSYLQTATIAIASLFGPSAMQALMSGYAAVAVVISGVQALGALTSVRNTETIVASSDPEEQSAFVFFGLSTVFLILCVGVYTWLVSLPAYKTITLRTPTRRTSTAENASLLSEESGIDPVYADRKPKQKHDIVRLVKTNAIFNIAVSYDFIVTLSVFPPITISVTSTNPAVHPLVFTAIHFLMFNIGDFSGRALLSIPRLRVWSAHRLLMISLLRTLFIPLFLMCNIQWGSTQQSSSPIIGSDAVFMLLMVALGLSNGYTSSMCMMAAPSLEHNPRLKGRLEDVDAAATVASFCLVGGLALGSMFSFGVRAAVCDCNPFAA